MFRSRASFLVLMVVLSSGCVGGGKSMSSEDRGRLKAYVLDTPPADMQKIDVNFENKVHLIGYKFEPDNGHPGSDVKLTYYWRCDDKLDDGWMLFTHTKDDGSGKLGNLDFVGPIREQKGSHQVLGPDGWEKGKIYVDEQTLKIPADATGAHITILTGIWKGDSRLRVLSGPNDGDNCAIVGKVGTGVTPKVAEEHTSTDPPSIVVPKLGHAAKITIDGKADEPEWGGAVSTGPFVDVGTGRPNSVFPVNGSAKLLWDDKNLYVFFQVSQINPYVGFTDAKSQPEAFTAGGQPKLWTKDTVEMMIEPDAVGDNHNYYELQINPQNRVFKSQFDTLQQPNGGPNGPFGHEDWDPKLKSAALLTKGSDGAAIGYTIEAQIPWGAFSKAANHPPKPGDVWRVNFYAMKDNGGVAWSPILGQGNFHKASRFGRITWGAASGTADAKTAPSAGASRPGVVGGPATPKTAVPLTP
jgi:hypothetical protein